MSITSPEYCVFAYAFVPGMTASLIMRGRNAAGLANGCAVVCMSAATHMPIVASSFMRDCGQDDSLIVKNDGAVRSPIQFGNYRLTMRMKERGESCCSFVRCVRRLELAWAPDLGQLLESCLAGYQPLER